MSLPSQGGIGFGGATRGRRRRGGRGGRGGPRKLLAAVVLVAIVGGMAWLFWPSGEPAAAEIPTIATPTRLADAEPVQERTSVPLGSSGKPATQSESARPTAQPARREAAAQPPATEQPQSRTVAAPDAVDRQQPAVLATPAPSETTYAPPAAPSAGVAALIERAESAIRANDPVAAREHYNRALLSERATAADRAQIREQIAALNEDLIFSPRVYPNDPFSTTYEVQPGDSLSRIAQAEGVATEWLLIQRVNRLSNPGGIYAGQKLKLVRGPFHAVVSKSAFRMDVYVGPPEEIDQWVFVRSFDVGLGEFDGTPLGVFKVRRHSKLINPFWRNPRTGEEFAADNPENPIGEHWIGLEGQGQAATFSGYGIHGTIEPDSIGQEMSMGCVRMLPEDVALVYELLSEQLSEVHIVE